MSIQKEHLWRNDITGLRALAVVPVLIYHAFPGVIPGGFFGVDIFFVISGFLISGIIFRGFKSDNFSWRTFYAKRVKRIIPNLILVLWFTLIFGWFFLFDGEYRTVGQAVYWGAGFLENFHLLKTKGYFDDASILNPLTHLWSLSVEEQFYIVFPLLAMGAVALGRRLEWVKAHARPLGAIAITFITLGSLALCLGTESTKHAFYWPWTRFWEISAGIVLAYAEIVYGFHLNRGIRQGLTWLGLAMVLWAFWGYDATIRTPGLFSLFAVLGAVFLIAAKPDALVNRTLLSWKPVTFIGLISYSLYLWHWPLLSFATIIWGGELTPYVLGVALIVSAVISTIVFYAVENPLRFVSKGRSRMVVMGLLIGLLLTVVAGQGVRLFKGFPNSGFRASVPYPQIINMEKELGKMSSCERDGVQFLCTHANRPYSMLVIGDSHAQQYVLKWQGIAENTNKEIALITQPGCWLFDKDRSSQEEVCKKRREEIPTLLKEPTLKVVLVVQKWGERNLEGFEAMGKTLKKWQSAYPEVKFFVQEDAPWEEGNKWQTRFNRLKLPKNIKSLTWVPDRGLPWDRANREVRESLPHGVEWLPLVEKFCPNLVCKAWVYIDDNHLSPYYLRDHATWLDEVEAYLKSLS